MADTPVDQIEEPASPPASEEPKESAVPYDRFKEVNESKKALEQQLADYKAAELKRQADGEAAKKKQLEEQNKFEELYKSAEAEKATATEQVTTLTGQIEALEKALGAQWETQKALIPEMFLSLIEDKPIAERIEWLSANSEKLQTADKGKGTPRRTTQKGITPPEPNGTQRTPNLPTFRI